MTRANASLLDGGGDRGGATERLEVCVRLADATVCGRVARASGSRTIDPSPRRARCGDAARPPSGPALSRYAVQASASDAGGRPAQPHTDAPSI